MREAKKTPLDQPWRPRVPGTVLAATRFRTRCAEENLRCGPIQPVETRQILRRRALKGKKALATVVRTQEIKNRRKK